MFIFTFPGGLLFTLCEIHHAMLPTIPVSIEIFVLVETARLLTTVVTPYNSLAMVIAANFITDTIYQTAMVDRIWYWVLKDNKYLVPFITNFYYPQFLCLRAT